MNSLQDGKQSRESVREALPVWLARERFLKHVKNSSTLILVGETGSGKTTLAPQLILDAGLAGHKGRIACTQPRRVAAISVARHVAQERNCEIGAEVGYTVRFDDCTSKNTRLRYMTDGMLLREALLDPILKNYSVVIVDEAHERTIAIDVLLAILKKALEARPVNFKVIIMSATLDAASFKAYFSNSTAAYVEGRLYPVDIFYTAEPQESYLDSAIAAVLQIHLDEGPGDILVFLTGHDDIEAAEQLLTQRASTVVLDSQSLGLAVVPLYAALSPEAQLRVFDPAPQGTRKVILATNIAETSVTIPGIRYVVDSGFVKMRTFSARLGADCLEVVPISKAQARQRSGRAGREGPGKVYRLYTETAFESLEATTDAEIKRANLASVVLQLKAMGIKDVLSFDFIDPPSRGALLRAFELLYALEALDTKGNLTEKIGRILARLPVDPMFGRCLIASAQLNCSMEMLIVVAMVSCDMTVFLTPREKREEALSVHRQFLSVQGDHCTLLNVYLAWNSVAAKKRRRWADDNFINNRALLKAHDIKEQLEKHLLECKLPISSCGDDWGTLRKGLVGGLFPHAAKLQADGTYRVLATGQQVSLHPSSILHGKRHSCIIFNELVRTTKQYVRCVTVIEPGWLVELAPTFFSRKQ